MSVWTRISDALSALAGGESLASVFERLRTPPERRVAFTIAVIALGAKMAKADGRVTRDEVAAFREVFHIPPSEERAAARVFDLAREDVAGFEDYAARIARMFRDDARPCGRDSVLCDLMEGLLHIAAADGDWHPGEEAFVTRVAEIFGIEETQFRRMRARHIPGETDPYAVLGVDPGADLATVRRAWRDEARDNHPDRLIARGVPEEAAKLAEARMAAVNAAWDAIRAERGAA
jgi:DnaJ like chaperone protein